MTKILVVAEHHDGKLNAATAKTVSAAAAISGASTSTSMLAPLKQRSWPASPRC